MKIYIASSWKNQHGVEMLTAILRENKFEVTSWIENNYNEGYTNFKPNFPFEEWMKTPEAVKSFIFDTKGATECDLFIYYGPAGKDACAELGAAWVKDIPIIGLYAKGEDLGLMRMMALRWYDRYTDIILAAIKFSLTNSREAFD